MKTITPMLKLSFLLSLFLLSFISNAQVGIGTTNPAGGSLLDIESAEKGILIPPNFNPFLVFLSKINHFK